MTNAPVSYHMAPLASPKDENWSLIASASTDGDIQKTKSMLYLKLKGAFDRWEEKKTLAEDAAQDAYVEYGTQKVMSPGHQSSVPKGDTATLDQKTAEAPIKSPMSEERKALPQMPNVEVIPVLPIRKETYIEEPYYEPEADILISKYELYRL